MKKITAAACSAAILLCAGNALATQYTLVDSVSFDKNGIKSGSDIELIDGIARDENDVLPTQPIDYGFGDVNRLDSSLFSHDYVTWTHNYSFEPMYDELLSAELSLNLIDDDKDCWFRWEFGLALTEDGIIDFGEVDTGNYKYDLSLENIGDGSYQVALIGLGGDFILDSSSLKIEYTAIGTPAPVPEPTTMVLFGVALGATGLTSFRRKIFKSGKQS